MIDEADRYVLAGRLRSNLKAYEEAVEIFTKGLSHYPDCAQLYRYRGHRYITLREFTKAIQDLQQAAELVEGKPDEMEFYSDVLGKDIIHIILGQEERVSDQHQLVDDASVEATKDLYKSTLKSSIFYHLALAHYLKGEFEDATNIYRKALSVAVDNDMKVATNDWLYMTLRRRNLNEEAKSLIENLGANIHKVIEPSYSRRMKMYQGDLAPDEVLSLDADDSRNLATQGYGVGNWYLYNGEIDKAKTVFSRVTELGSSDAFGYIASEVELERLTA